MGMPCLVAFESVVAYVPVWARAGSRDAIPPLVCRLVSSNELS